MLNLWFGAWYVIVADNYTHGCQEYSLEKNIEHGTSLVFKTRENAAKGGV